MKLYKYKNSVLKTYFSLIIEYGMYLSPSVFRNLAPLLVQNKPSAPTRRKQSLERQCHSEKRSFVNKKETAHYFELSLSFVSFIGVFSILKCKTLVLKTTT